MYKEETFKVEMKITVEYDLPEGCPSRPYTSIGVNEDGEIIVEGGNLKDVLVKRVAPLEPVFIEQHGFDYVLTKLKNGCLAYRQGWNGKNLYVGLAQEVPFKNLNPFFYIADLEGKKKANTWVPSVSDLLANDWVVCKYENE